MGGHRTRKEAELAFAELSDEVRHGDYVEPSRTTVGRFLEAEWLPAIRSRVRETGWDHYRSIITGYVLDGIGDLRLADLTPAQLNPCRESSHTLPVCLASGSAVLRSRNVHIAPNLHVRALTHGPTLSY
jgi:hypothetical protein